MDGYDTFVIVHDAAAVADGTVATGRAFVDVGGRLLTGAAIVGPFGDGLTQLSDPRLVNTPNPRFRPYS